MKKKRFDGKRLEKLPVKGNFLSDGEIDVGMVVMVHSNKLRTAKIGNDQCYNMFRPYANIMEEQKAYNLSGLPLKVVAIDRPQIVLTSVFSPVQAPIFMDMRHITFKECSEEYGEKLRDCIIESNKQMKQMGIDPNKVNVE